MNGGIKKYRLTAKKREISKNRENLPADFLCPKNLRNKIKNFERTA